MNTNRKDAVLDCGGKRSATPLSDVLMAPKDPAFRASQSGVAATLCHRSPNPIRVHSWLFPARNRKITGSTLKFKARIKLCLGTLQRCDILQTHVN